MARRKRAIRVLGATLAVCGVAAASSAVTAQLVTGGGMSATADSVPPQLPAVGEDRVVVAGLSTGEVNSSLNTLAKDLAGAVGDPKVRSAIHDEVAKRFDGDHDALWSALEQRPAFDEGVTASHDRGRSAKSTDRSVDATADTMPRLQVAVPAKFASWDPSTYAPLVAYFPEGVDDTTVESITAYDSAGNAVQLDAQTEPNRPVIVIGLNERTDDAGNKRPSTPTSEPGDSTIMQASVVNTALTKYAVTLREVHLIDDKEPWAKGDAEISFAARSRGCSGTNYEDYDTWGLNNDGDELYLNLNLGLTTCDVVFAWWEDDGGSWNFELSYDDFGFGIGMDDDDDMIGKKQIPYASFAGATRRKDSWSALEQWTE